MKSGAKTYPKAVDTIIYIAFFEGSLDQPVEALSSPEFCDLWPNDARP